MSILKGILHHWNKTTKSYDTIHPETEVAQITDWNNGIVNALASTGLSSLVNVLSSDSLLALLIKKVFDAMGVKYSLSQDGYVCFGSLFGGLIIQWVIAKGETINWPIAFTKCYGAIPVSLGAKIGDESIQKNEEGNRGAISFSETGIKSWYIRDASGVAVYNVYVEYFGVGTISQSQ